MVEVMAVAVVIRMLSFRENCRADDSHMMMSFLETGEAGFYER